jgi:hypothetical protein
MPRVDTQAEFVVASAEVLYESVACADHLRRAQLFQSAHGPQPGLPSAVIGLDGIIAHCSTMWQAVGSSSSTTRG